ncbi:unnamed protein product [Orchesella dallaii]|uniref:Uncharacterized protein n=1 Tax=Orchesella dallaii TaxID=48710 RepID=A0ABP1RVU0_9HEXA
MKLEHDYVKRKIINVGNNAEVRKQLKIERIPPTDNVKTELLGRHVSTGILDKLLAAMTPTIKAKTKTKSKRMTDAQYHPLVVQYKQSKFLMMDIRKKFQKKYGLSSHQIGAFFAHQTRNPSYPPTCRRKCLSCRIKIENTN